MTTTEVLFTATGLVRTGTQWTKRYRHIIENPWISLSRGKRFESVRWLSLSCFSARLRHEAASPLRYRPQLARTARDMMQLAYLSS